MTERVTDGPKGGCDQWLQWSPHPQLQDVARCSKAQCNCDCSCTCSVVDVVELCNVVVGFLVVIVVVGVVWIKCS